MTRTSLSTTLGIGTLMATGVGFVISPMLIDAYGFLAGAVMFGAVGTLLMTLPYFAAPKGGAKPVPVEKLPPMSEVLWASLKHKRFLAVIMMFAGAQMSLTIMTSAAPYIAEKILGGTLGDVAWLLGPFLVAAVPTFFLVPKFARRFGWEKATAVGTIALSIAYVGAGFLGKGIIGSPMTTAMIVFACAGPGAAFVLGLEGEAIVRCAEQSKFKSTGIYFGVYNFIVKMLNGLALFLAGVLADMGSVGAIRAMPICAGVLCLSGVLLYGALKGGPSGQETETL